MCSYNGLGYLKLLNKSTTPYTFLSIRNIAYSSHPKIVLLFFFLNKKPLTIVTKPLKPSMQ